jgi:RNA polymerase sigma factor (sigma-70 family)
MDDDIARRAAGGDTHAFGEICCANRTELIGTAMRIVRDPEAAEDLVQEALLECYVNISDLRDAEAILPWIRGTIRNRCYNHLRGRRTVAFPIAHFEETPVSTPTPLAHVESLEAGEQVRRALGRLSEKNRRATELFYLEEKSVAEVAAVLGISLTATRVRLNRSRAHLKRLLTRGVSLSGALAQEVCMGKTNSKTTEDMTCSFCSKPVEDLELLVTGPGVNICSKCVQACVHVMIKNHGYSLQLAPVQSESVSSRISSPA